MVTKMNGVAYMRRFAFLVACLEVSACTQPDSQPYLVATPFNPAEVAWAAAPGTASIHGQAFMKTRGGDVKTCAGEKIQLTPESGYTREIYQRSLLGPIPGLANADSRARILTHNTVCDAQGNFNFKGLPAGSWFLNASVHWEVPFGQGLIQQGAWIQQSVTTQAGEQAEVIVSR